MVLEAARYPFARVVGLELAEPLHRIAESNVAHTRMRRRCNGIDLVCGDILEYRIPDDITVVFMNNPFRGSVFAAAVGELIATYDRRPRGIRLIYYNPVEHETLIHTGRFELVRTIHRRLTKSADPFRTTAVYRMLPRSAG